MTGLDFFSYYNTGTYGSPTWTLLTNIKDLDKNLDIATVDGSTRASRLRQLEATLLEFGVTFGYVKKSGDATIYTALRTAAFARTQLDLAMADGAIATTGTIYIRSQQIIKKWAETEPLDGIVMANIETFPTDVITHPTATVTV